jgi:hypothetical protein
VAEEIQDPNRPETETPDRGQVVVNRVKADPHEAKDRPGHHVANVLIKNQINLSKEKAEDHPSHRDLMGLQGPKGKERHARLKKMTSHSPGAKAGMKVGHQLSLRDLMVARGGKKKEHARLKKMTSPLPGARVGLRTGPLIHQDRTVHQGRGANVHHARSEKRISLTVSEPAEIMTGLIAEAKSLSVNAAVQPDQTAAQTAVRVAVPKNPGAGVTGMETAVKGPSAENANSRTTREGSHRSVRLHLTGFPAELRIQKHRFKLKRSD